MIEVIGIAYREKKRGEMIEVSRSLVTQEQGLCVDFKRRSGKRQITLMSSESWQHACAELALTLPWTIRRANILVQGYTFSAADVGKTISIGDVKIKINFETDPCELMDQQQPGLRAALTPDWRGGVCGTVIADGEVKLGDQVIIN